jgi:outer membrane cobalamin receptor
MCNHFARVAYLWPRMVHNPNSGITMKRTPWLAALLLAALFAAAPSQAQTGRNRNRIEREEIEQSHASNVLDLVRGRRTAWLQRQHPSGFMDPTSAALLVFVDGAQLDGVNELQQIAAANVERVEFLTPAQVEFRFGKPAMNGAISVTSRGTQPLPTAQAQPSQGG